ncbi:hypothetical protein MJL48_29485, partial [Salmonella enterica subsp. enterica serovar Kentucky]|nr:hypothetical protein [Salmonella enterica subsp. enterica serovar Kentucky]
PTKPLATQRDLALAYSPGVAAPCLEIEKDPLAAYKYTARGNLLAAGFIQELFLMAHQINITTATSGNRFYRIAGLHQLIVNGKI